MQEESLHHIVAEKCSAHNISRRQLHIKHCTGASSAVHSGVARPRCFLDSTSLSTSCIASTSAIEKRGKEIDLKLSCPVVCSKFEFETVLKRNRIFCFGRIRIFGGRKMPNISSRPNIRFPPNIRYLAEYLVIFGQIASKIRHLWLNIWPNIRKST